MNNSKSLKINFIWNTIGSFTYLFCQWLLTFLVIKLSSNLEDAGNLSLAISITNIFFNISCFNVRPYLVSDKNNEYSIENYTSFRLVTIVISIISCFIYSLFFGYNSQQLLCIMLYMIFKIGEAIVDLFHAFEQKNSRMDIGGISLLVRGIISVLLFTIGMLFFNSINCAILLMVIVTYIFIFTYDLKNVKKFINIKINIKSKRLFDMFLRFLPLAIGTFLLNTACAFPRQMLEKINGSDILGIYATIGTPAVIMQVAASYIYNPLLVTFSDYRNSNNYKKFRSLLFKGIAVLFCLSLVCYIGSLFLSELFLNLLFGAKISNHYQLFSIIIIYTSLSGLCFFLHNILVILRRIKSLLFIYLTGFIICLIISSSLINKYYMNGVSYSLIIFTLVMIIEMFIIIIAEIKKMMYNKASLKRG